MNAGGPGAPTIWRGAVRVSLVAVLLAAAGCGSAVPSPATGVAQATAPSGSSAPTVPKRLRVLGTNDFHGNLRPHIPEWSGGCVSTLQNAIAADVHMIAGFTAARTAGSLTPAFIR